MYKIYDFVCLNGHKHEELVESGISVSRCKCGADSIRVPSATKCQLDGASGDFPGAHMKWVREHEKAGKRIGTPEG